MHLISSNKNSRPQATVDLPLLVFKHGTKRKFLSRPESFEEMTRVVRRKFNIDQDTQIAFEVADYDVCGNERVEVDESAYQTMAPYLDEMHIVTTPAANQSESSRLIPNSKGKGKECTTQNDSPVLITPIASGSEDLDHVDELLASKQPESQLEQDIDQLIDEEEQLSKAAKTVPQTKSVSPSISVKPEPPALKPVSSSNPKNPTTSKPPSTASKPPSTLATTFASSKPSTSSKPPSLANTTKPSTNTASKSSPRSPELIIQPSTNANTSNSPPPATEQRKADELFNDSVAVEDEIIVDENEDDNKFFLGRQFGFGVSDAVKGKQKEKASKAPVDEADIIDVDEEPERPMSSVTRKILAQTQSKTTTEDDIEQQEERTVSVKTSTSRRVPKSTTQSPSKSRSRFQSEQDDGPPPATQGPFQTTSTQQTDLVTADGRFKVYIEGPKRSHRAEFMTKSRHTVKKVLAGACKTFRLDATKAHLEHHITDEDDSDIETYVKCKSEDTIGKAGIKPGAMLRVVVRGFEEDDDEDEDEDEDEYL